MRYLDTTVYNRLFTKILDSSIWLEPSTTRIVWITLLAAMDEDGYAHFSAIENLASRARVTTEEAQKAVECFLAPDPNSENTEHEGRRVERVPGGFFILNAEHHRKLLNREIRREQTRVRVARHREKLSGNKESVTGALRGVTPASASDVTSVQKEEEGTREKRKPENEEAVVAYCQKIGLTADDGHYYWDKWQAGGYVNAGKPIRDWQALIRSHKAAGYCPSLKNPTKQTVSPNGLLPRFPEYPDEAKRYLKRAQMLYDEAKAAGNVEERKRIYEQIEKVKKVFSL